MHRNNQSLFQNFLAVIVQKLRFSLLLTEVNNAEEHILEDEQLGQVWQKYWRNLLADKFDLLMILQVK